jgi:Xaa-Pro aminopeptidase
MDFDRRLRGVRGLLRGVDGLLITDIVNVRYLTGFQGSSGFVLLTRTEGIFVTDFRYELQAHREVAGFDVIIEKGDVPRAVKRLAEKTGIRRLGVEESVSFGLASALQKRDLALVIIRNAVARVRAVKDEGETALIREAVRRAEQAFLQVKPFIRVGVRESTIARRLEDRLRRQGVKHLPFDSIVASGPNSAMPHAGVTERRLAPGDFVVIDWGGEAGGYYSDMTRTLLLRGPSMAKKKEIYGVVRRAQRRGIASVGSRVKASQIDNSARDVIKKAGYGRYFGHSLGHGVGLEVHEAPRVSGKNRAAVREGMVFTVEPGVYVPGLGGVRIEDMVMVRRSGADVLTSLPTGLEIVGP